MFSGSCWEETCVDHSSHSFEGRNQLNQWSQLFVVFSPSLSVCSNCTVISTSHWPRLIITPEQQQQHWLKNSCSHFSATDCTSPSMLSSSVKRHILVQVWRRKDQWDGVQLRQVKVAEKQSWGFVCWEILIQARVILRGLSKFNWRGTVAFAFKDKQNGAEVFVWW